MSTTNNNIEDKAFTWQDLYDHIATMSEEERKSPIIIVPEDESASDTISIKKEDEDLVYTSEYPEDGLHLRSEWEQEYGYDLDPDLLVKANTTYLYIHKKI